MQERIGELNNTVWATLKPSLIQGIGVFAIRDIPKGTKITDHSVYDDPKEIFAIHVKDFDKIEPSIRKLILDRYMFPEEANVLCFYSPNRDANLRSFMNYAEDPNTDGEYALRDIKEGEEITEDYLKNSHSLTKKHYESFLKSC